MKMATKLAQAEEDGETIEQVKQRFALWRDGRKRGEHISGALWAAAVRMVRQHGLQRTAQELHVDCGRLKKRLEGNGAPALAGKAEPQFVEIFSRPALSATHTCACIVEMENAWGGKMRVELKGLDGLTDLSNAFWRAR